MSGRQPTRKAIKKDVTGSPQPGEPVFLVVGKLRRPHGFRGEILMEVLTDFPERLKPGKEVYLGSAPTGQVPKHQTAWKQLPGHFSRCRK